jgi:hypothetical protein
LEAGVYRHDAAGMASSADQLVINGPALLLSTMKHSICLSARMHGHPPLHGQVEAGRGLSVSVIGRYVSTVS